MTAKLRVAVLFGGRSSEHSVSCVSAASVLGAIDRTKYDLVPIGIARDGRWVLVADDPASLVSQGRTLPSIEGDHGERVMLPAEPSVSSLIALDLAKATPAFGKIDVAFPLLHGKFGEDGTIQGLLEMAGVPYVGSGVFASAASMDKVHMKRLLAAAGLPIGPYVVIEDRQWRTDREGCLARCARLGLPVYAKPASGGSSIGISRVTAADQLEAAIESAREHDRKVVIEGAIVGREVECGVLENVDGSGAQASVPAEIRVRDESAFYDFEAKYLDDSTELIVPADLPAPVVDEIQKLSLEAFDALACSGLARVDFFVADDETVTVNEVNTMPGFTPTSVFPRVWAASGVPYPELIDRLVQRALQRSTT